MNFQYMYHIYLLFYRQKKRRQIHDALSITLRKREENLSCFYTCQTGVWHIHEIFRFRGTIKLLISIVLIKDEYNVKKYDKLSYKKISCYLPLMLF